MAGANEAVLPPHLSRGNLLMIRIDRAGVWNVLRQ
jgi:hypothetical protein